MSSHHSVRRTSDPAVHPNGPAYGDVPQGQMDTTAARVQEIAAPALCQGCGWPLFGPPPCVMCEINASKEDELSWLCEEPPSTNGLTPQNPAVASHIPILPQEDPHAMQRCVEGQPPLIRNGRSVNPLVSPEESTFIQSQLQRRRTIAQIRSVFCLKFPHSKVAPRMLTKAIKQIRNAEGTTLSQTHDLSHTRIDTIFSPEHQKLLTEFVTQRHEQHTLFSPAERETLFCQINQERSKENLFTISKDDECLVISHTLVDLMLPNIKHRDHKSTVWTAIETLVKKQDPLGWEPWDETCTLTELKSYTYFRVDTLPHELYIAAVTKKQAKKDLAGAASSSSSITQTYPSLPQIDEASANLLLQPSNKKPHMEEEEDGSFSIS